MKVSVYIPVFNGARYLAATIEALLAQSRPFDEIIVIDDGSSDHSSQIAEKFKVTTVRHSCNKGIAAARNTGITRASYELVAAIDADCVLHTEWLARCLPFFENETVAGVGGRMDEVSACSRADRWRARNLSQHFGDTTKQVDFLCGSNTVFRKSVLNKVGLYAEKYRRNHEDTDISERIRAAGFELMYVPQARARHMKRDSLFSVMRTCWGFRHKEYPPTVAALWRDMVKETLHGLSILTKSIVRGQVGLIPFDCMYPFIQCYFSIKAYIFKSAQFE
jgi:glycosyltransferase involved in cell wall biosynthesis